MDIFDQILFNLHFNIAIAIMSAGCMLFNVLILRLRKAYYPLNFKHMIWLSAIPGLNVAFLAMSCIIGCMNIGCYTVIDKRRKKPTAKKHTSNVPKSNIFYTVKNK
ncbi:MAG: hypothetical protein RR776_13120 [Niameybacter sp.]|uniref:hypothetical protein n=1 Tax=Niameybacter sp. TaxID=2033640 RepID=UPI002FCC0409